jgi:hypothetical protein
MTIQFRKYNTERDYWENGVGSGKHLVPEEGWQPLRLTVGA